MCFKLVSQKLLDNNFRVLLWMYQYHREIRQQKCILENCQFSSLNVKICTLWSLLTLQELYTMNSYEVDKWYARSVTSRCSKGQRTAWNICKQCVQSRQCICKHTNSHAVFGYKINHPPYLLVLLHVQFVCFKSWKNAEIDTHW